MKKIIFILFGLFLVNCSGIRQTRILVNQGEYDLAIDRCIASLQANKTAKRKQKFTAVLEDAFEKAKKRDLNEIYLLNLDSNPANYERVFDLYNGMHNRQEKIKPLLPLSFRNRHARFVFEDYGKEIVQVKAKLVEYLYNNAAALLQSKDKMYIRKAYDDLEYLNRLSPNYKNTRELMSEAQFLGTDYIHVSTQNATNMVIPQRLQDDLLNFSTYGINDKWTVFHNNRQKNIKYDYAMTINFRDINISPEQVREKQFVKEKQIKDGVKTLLDDKGNVVKDSLGNAIKVDNFKTISISIYEFTQFKSCQVTAKVDYTDLVTNQLINTFPLSSEYVFEYIYANYNGDKRACEEAYYMFFDRRAVLFPSNEQMVFDTGEDLKAKLKTIISRNRFRR